MLRWPTLLLQTGQRLDEVEELAQKAAELEPAAENLFLLTLVRRTQGDSRRCRRSRIAGVHA